MRNTILYVLQNWRRHGMVTFGDGLVDPLSTAPRFDGWVDTPVVLVETEPWPKPRARTWLLEHGWTKGGGLLHTSDAPPAAATTRLAPIVRAYVANLSTS